MWEGPCPPLPPALGASGTPPSGEEPPRSAPPGLGFGLCNPSQGPLNNRRGGRRPRQSRGPRPPPGDAARRPSTSASPSRSLFQASGCALRVGLASREKAPFGWAFGLGLQEPPFHSVPGPLLNLPTFTLDPSRSPGGPCGAGRGLCPRPLAQEAGDLLTRKQVILYYKVRIRRSHHALHA